MRFGCRALLLKQKGPRFLMKALQTSREGNRQLSGGILAILAGASTCGAVSAVSPHCQLLWDADSIVHMSSVPSAHCWRVVSHACLLPFLAPHLPVFTGNVWQRVVLSTT